MFWKKDVPPDDKLGTYNLKHVQGLDLPDITCSIQLHADKVIIAGGSVEYCLKMDNISSISCELNVDVERFNQSNKVAGVIGAVAMGTTGAVIGSASSSKVKRQVTNLVTLSYHSADGSLLHLLFQNIEPNDQQAARFVDKIRPLIKSAPPTQIEL